MRVTVSVIVSVIVAMLLAVPGLAHAERELCARNAVYRGTAIDLDVKNADIHDVFRLLSDVGRVNVVVPDDVNGKVTLRLKRVPWDQVACTVAAVHQLTITIDGNVLLVLPKHAPR